MIGDVIKTVANVALDVCAAKTIQLNSEERPATRQEREKQQQQRRTISNVRNAAWLLKRLF